MRQALSLWSSLHDAERRPDSYNIVELYLYRFMPYSPLASPEDADKHGETGRAAAAEAYGRANVAMHDLLQHFAAERGVTIKVNDRDLGEWLKTADFRHRVTVSVIKR